MRKNELLKKVTCEPLDVLMQEASTLRKKKFNNTIELCCILNARSGRCSEDCKYCAQSTHYNTTSAVYPFMDTEKILAAAQKAYSAEIKYFSIVTSGDKLRGNEFKAVCKAIKKIHLLNECKVCASLGVLGAEEFAELKSAGLDRYHHNLETSENFYPKICTTHSWRERYNTVQNAKDAGFEVCSGGLFGLGESWKERIDLAFTIKELDIDSVPINFLSPIQGTPLGNQKLLSTEEALRIIVLYRLIMPNKAIRICGGRPTVLKEKQNMIFAAGANALMTGDYLTTSGTTYDTDKEMIKKLDLQ